MKRIICILLALATMATPCRAEEIIAVIHSEPQANALGITEAPPINDVSIDLDEADANGHQLEYLGEFTITYYCPCKRCNGKWGAIDRYGNPLKFGTVAVDAKVIPMHAKIVVDGYDQVFEALDTGSGVHGKHIDMFVPVSHSEALQMGQGERRKVWLWKE